MADQTQKMISLLGLMRKQMNGAVADSMYYYGSRYGLNYGVSLPTVRQIASTEERDHALARYLYKQQVRELRLAALHIAEPEQMTIDEADFWAEGVINSEVAEEMAFALLSHTPALAAIFDKWASSGNEYLTYAALMAASRSDLAHTEKCIGACTDAVAAYPSSRIIAQGVVAVLSAAASKAENIGVIRNTIDAMSDSSTASYIAEEMEWRLEAIQ